MHYHILGLCISPAQNEFCAKKKSFKFALFDQAQLLSRHAANNLNLILKLEKPNLSGCICVVKFFKYKELWSNGYCCRLQRHFKLDFGGPGFDSTLSLFSLELCY